MDANTILFDQGPSGHQLFKTQLDLVNALLNDSDTAYFIDNKQVDLYNRAQSRLKTYISQLLSRSAIRTITEDFKRGLLIVISKRIGSEETAEQIVNNIILSLEEKNSSLVKNEPKGSLIEDFYNDFYTASYIAIITSKPLEIEADINPNKFSLRKALFQDFLDTLTNPSKDFKNYRFNFPLESSATLFWKGFRKLLIKSLIQNLNDLAFFEILYSKFAIKTITIDQINRDNQFKESHIEEIADEILVLLNTTKRILVFTCESPIYSIPLIAINPAEAKNSRLYALLDGEKQETYVYKYPNEEIVLWRLFVWDKLKTKSYEGRNIEFKPAHF